MTKKIYLWITVIEFFTDNICTYLANIPDAEFHFALGIYANMPSTIDETKQLTILNNANTTGFTATLKRFTQLWLS